MAFENDIFISYAHIDNETMSDDEKGWITALHRALEVRLAQLLGKKPRIFRDPKLAGNDAFDRRLIEELPKTATLVSVFSPRYVGSEWCTRELIEFLRFSAEAVGTHVGTRSRVFKLIKTPVPFEKHPEPVQNLLGYEFYHTDPDTGRATELNQDAAPEEKREYWAKINDLCYDLSELLETLQGVAGHELAALGGSAAPASVPGQTVYVAETSYDLREQRGTVVRHLQQHGHTVLPDATLPLVADECSVFLREQLDRATMSIHLVGKSYGIVPEGTQDSMVALQNEAAIERATGDAGFQRLIWLPQGLQTDDERQAELIGKIRNDPRIQEGADILETPLSDLEIAIDKKMAALLPPPEAIFLAETCKDLDEKREELRAFLEEKGFVVVPKRELPRFSDDCRAYLETEIADCRMSIHMVGKTYGLVPDATEQSVLELQTEVARARALEDERFVRLVWLPPDLEPGEERQKRFLTTLEESEEIVRVPFEELAELVERRLAPPEEEEEKPQPEPEAAADDDSPPTVYLICDQEDADSARDLEDFLFDAGFEVTLPLFDGDETEIREEHEEALKSCDAVLIYYGEGNEAWQRRMTREIKKCAGYGRKKPPPKAAIYLAPPETPTKKRFRTREATILTRSGEGFLADDLKPFLDELRS